MFSGKHGAGEVTLLTAVHETSYPNAGRGKGTQMPAVLTAMLDAHDAEGTAGVEAMGEVLHVGANLRDIILVIRRDPVRAGYVEFQDTTGDWHNIPASWCSAWAGNAEATTIRVTTWNESPAYYYVAAGYGTVKAIIDASLLDGDTA